MGAHELWVGTLFPQTGSSQSDTIFHACPAAELPIAVQSANHGGVNGELSSTKERQAIHYNFQPPPIDSVGCQIKVSTKDIGGDASTCFAADPGCHAFQSPTTLAQHSCPGTSCPVVARWVEWVATPARVLGEREGWAKSAQQDHPKMLPILAQAFAHCRRVFGCFFCSQVTADYGQEPQVGVGKRHFRGGMADDSPRTSAAFKRVALIRTQRVIRPGKGSQEGSLAFGSPGRECEEGGAQAGQTSVKISRRSESGCSCTSCLEAAIAALGDHDDQARKSLEEALAKAKKSANVAPVGVRLNSAMNFIERTRKKVGNKRRRNFPKKEEEVRQSQSQRAE